MEFVGQLWLPIVLSAVIVFVGSAIIWMALPHHKTEWKAAPNQDALQNAFKGAAPGLYCFPCPSDPKQRQSPESMKKWAEGPSGWLTLIPPGPFSMGGNMVRSVIFYLVTAFFAAYVASHVMPMGGASAPTYLQVFRVVGTIGFMAFGFGSVPDSIWFGRPWRSTVYVLADSLFLGLLMGGTFGWLWPR